jgi:putative GTP pyrophosphokinase
MNPFFKKHHLEIKTAEDYLLTVINNILTEHTTPENKMVEHVASRIKTLDSITEKLTTKGLEVTEDNAIAHLSDIIGVRLVVHFISDIYRVRNMIVDSGKLQIIREKDYVKQPKPSGYRSYHIVLEVPMNDVTVRAEIQLRTVAMDCWASLEHQIRYKKNIPNIQIIHKELKKCSDDLMSADITMEQIKHAVCDAEGIDKNIPDIAKGFVVPDVELEELEGLA